MDGRRAMALLGVSCLVGALPFAVGSPPARPAAGAPAGVAAAVPEPTGSPTDTPQAVPPTACVDDDTGCAHPGAGASPAPYGETTAGAPPDGPSAQAARWEAPDCLVVRCVALTFDDGPVADTRRLLGILNSAGVEATFFDIGEMAADNPDMVRAELEAGHEVGNHSWSHPQLTRLTDEQVGEQAQRTSQELASIDGLRPTLFRPPYGDVNPRVRAVLREHGDPVILWSVDTLDWLHRDPDSVYRRAVDGVRPGSIVLMHDIHPTTVDAVPRIIAELRRRGYTFVTVSELFGGKLEPGELYTGREQEWDQRHRPAPDPAAPDTGQPDPTPQQGPAPAPDSPADPSAQPISAPDAVASEGSEPPPDPPQQPAAPAPAAAPPEQSPVEPTTQPSSVPTP